MLALWLVAALIAFQSHSFEAASVRPYNGPAAYRMAGNAGRLTYTNVTLVDLILKAYDIRSHQLKSAPAWLDTARFEVIATFPAESSKEDLQVMLQGLLESRFKLAVHRETHDGRYYELVLDKGGPKLKAPAKVPEHGSVEFDAYGTPQIPAGPLGRPVTLAGKNVLMMVSGGQVVIMANSQPLSALAQALAKAVDAPVKDLTGVTGDYDFTLSFAAPGTLRMAPAGPQGERPETEPPLTLFQELKDKLGLRLDAKRGPIEVLVFDRAEKVPTGN